MGRLAVCITLAITVYAPTAPSPPYFSSEVFSATLRRLSVLCIIKGDTPRAITGRMILGSIRICSLRILMAVFLPNKNFSTHAAETP